MKKWYRALWAKIVIFILCVISFAVAFASAAGIAGMGVIGVYWKSEQYMQTSARYELVSRDAYDIIHMAVNSYVTIDHYEAEMTNLRYAVIAPDGSILQSNLTNAENVGNWQYTFYYQDEETIEANRENTIESEEPGEELPEDELPEDEEIVDESEGSWKFMHSVPESAKGERYTVLLSLDAKMAVDDRYCFAENIVELMYAMRYPAIGIVIVSGFLFLFSFVLLMCTSGRRPEDEALHPGYFHRIPFDALLLLVGVPLVIGLEIVIKLAVWNLGDVAAVVLMVIYGVFAFTVFLGICMSFACRIKAKTLVSGTLLAMLFHLLCRCCRFLWKETKRLFAAIPLVPKMVLALLASAFVDAVLLSAMWWGEDWAFALWVIKTIIVFLLLLHAAVSLKTILRASRALASGDLTHSVETDAMWGTFKQLGGQLNDISKGMAIAVEERTRSERMKSELVTNVSHDIKTPLTSIINYADLIAGESCENAHHGEYSEVLKRKSVQLKRLLEDLVEISKANTGALEIDAQRMDAGILLSQTAGEFEKRCEAAGLTLVTTLPEEKIEIMADGRRMWRVLENLMNNAVKYSLPGSRVYVDLHRENDQAVFLFRNTSKQALHVSPAELTERFVRGDAARGGEGSGLGLSIAKSLVELQKGSMDLQIDGDLFKVSLRFPTV